MRDEILAVVCQTSRLEASIYSFFNSTSVEAFTNFHGRKFTSMENFHGS